MAEWRKCRKVLRAASASEKLKGQISWSTLKAAWERQRALTRGQRRQTLRAASENEKLMDLICRRTLTAM